MYGQRPVQTFKKGPDYIDAAWLGLAAGCLTKNLDPYFSSPQKLVQIFKQSCHHASLALIEGNRGLHDGLDALGSCSSATLAKILQAPVLLVVDCTKMTRTVAALVLGCAQLDPEVVIGGVILNKLGSSRQENIIRQALELYTDVPVLGALPRLSKPLLAERKLGLSGITADSSSVLDDIATFVTNYVDTDAIERLASSTYPVPSTCCSPLEDKEDKDVFTRCLAPVKKPSSSASLAFQASQPAQIPQTFQSPSAHGACSAPDQAPSPAPCQVNVDKKGTAPTIGYIYDDALWFYYPENLDALHQAGARLLRLSFFNPFGWDEVNGLYLGGGHLDSHIAPLCQSPQLQKLSALAHDGLPIYLEGSALALACRELVIAETAYPMAGIFDASMTLTSRPHGLGYTQALVSGPTPFFDEGSTIIGHQFNYFRFDSARQLPSYLTLSKGRGLFQTAIQKGEPTTQETPACRPTHSYANTPHSSQSAASFAQHDGLVHLNTCASLSFLFAPATPQWAPRFVQLCKKQRKS